MNCREARQHWNLYHDSEGDAELHFQIADHLSLCEDCATWFSRQDRLNNCLWTMQASSHSVPPMKTFDKRMFCSSLEPTPWED
jgi:predicted anti-sigma-YlaC factor YlaD